MEVREYEALAVYKSPNILHSFYLERRTGKMLHIYNKLKKERGFPNASGMPYYKKTPKTLASCVYNLKHVPEELITNELIMSAIKRGMSFGQIPKHMRNAEFAMFTIEQHRGRIKTIPLKYQTQEMADLALEYRLSLACVHKKFITPENTLRAVKRALIEFNYVPEHLITKEMIDVCMKHDKSAIYSRSQFRSAVMKILRYDCSSFMRMPDDWKRKEIEICKLAVSIDPNMIAYVPQDRLKWI